MDSIGSLLKETRESSGVTTKEASDDLSIKEEYILNIESGNIGCFKDIFELKNYIINYAKYLGINSDKLIDEFNEYMFEYTSKIPLKAIEKQAKLDAKEETSKVVSPYTRKPRKYSKKYYIGIYLVIILLIVLAIIWSIRQITIGNTKTNVVSYVELRK